MGLAAVTGLTPEELREMASVDVRTVDIDTLTDLRDIQIDTKAPVEIAPRFSYVTVMTDYINLFFVISIELFHKFFSNPNLHINGFFLFFNVNGKPCIDSSLVSFLPFTCCIPHACGTPFRITPNRSKRSASF